jgi:predicted nucleic acid-binding protein
VSKLVCDASALIAMLLDSGPDGQWAAEAIKGSELAAPALVDWEAANIMRRHELAGLITSDQASQAHADLQDLAIEKWPYELVAARSWRLRANLTIYDASYVALAVLLSASLVTLDGKIARAPGIECEVLTR